MTKQIILEQVLALIPEESKEACVAEIRACESKEQKIAVLEKYGVDVQAEIKNYNVELDDTALDVVAGGALTGSGCGCGSSCSNCGFPCC